MNRRRLTLTVFAVAAITGAAALGYRTGQRLDAATAALSDEGLLRPTVSEWLAIPTPANVVFETLEGGSKLLADYRGRVVILNFWGTWCPPCIREIPELVRLQPYLEQIGGTVLGPAVDSGSSEAITEFAEEMAINYPIFRTTTNQAVGTFAAAGYPYTLLIDREGVIRKTYLGPQNMPNLLADVRQLEAGG
ncbi:MAG: TlpA family protein disulfide reductase [Gemmatimonadota bacterium]|nr:TlpA family protein disulfide reductase [Gemmatimonadota bacterium]MDH3427583.1 TlpA family protein disulfide reductase [Gemmatimonadota bacterium]